MLTRIMTSCLSFIFIIATLQMEEEIRFIHYLTIILSDKRCKHLESPKRRFIEMEIL